jgi:hypothetical protein
MSNNTIKLRKQRKVGKSIEQIIVERKFDSSNPTTWPVPVNNGLIVNNSLPDLVNTSTEKDNYSDNDKTKIIETLMSYCRSLQSKVDVNKFKT